MLLFLVCVLFNKKCVWTFRQQGLLAHLLNVRLLTHQDLRCGVVFFLRLVACQDTCYGELAFGQLLSSEIGIAACAHSKLVGGVVFSCCHVLESTHHAIAGACALRLWSVCGLAVSFGKAHACCLDKAAGIFVKLCLVAFQALIVKLLSHQFLSVGLADELKARLPLGASNAAGLNRLCTAGACRGVRHTYLRL